MHINPTRHRSLSCCFFGGLIPLFILSFSFAYAEEAHDPIEGFNRGVYRVNECLDKTLMEPAAKGYNAVVPDEFQTAFSNFFVNLDLPQYLVADLVSLEFESAGIHLLRFGINSTLGIAGLVDVAAKLGLKHEETDFGVALGKWGVPAGPYLVLPLMGPSNFRDAVGRGVDSFLNPLGFLNYISGLDNISDGTYWALFGLDVVNTRSQLLPIINAGRESAVDFYLFSQSAYYQRRNSLINPAMSDEALLDDDLDLLDDEDLEFLQEDSN